MVKVKRMILIKPDRKKPALQPWQKGIKCIIKSIMALYSLLVTHGPLDYIILRRVNQDLLENFFSLIRAICGDNAHPDQVEYMIRFRILLIGRWAEILVNNPAVEMESNNEDIAKEQQEIATTVANKGYQEPEIVTKVVTKDIPMIARVYEIDTEDDIPDFENYDGEVTTTTISEVDIDAHREYQQHWELESQTIIYVAGWFAKKNKEFKLGAKTTLGLYEPTEEWLEDFRKFEQEFINYHESEIKQEDWVIDNFAKVLESKFGDKYPKVLYKKFSKFRTTMRVKALNKKTMSGKVMVVSSVRDHKQMGQHTV